jgi:hypothetical protein
MNQNFLKFNIQATFVAFFLSVLGHLAFNAWFPAKYFAGFDAVIVFHLLATIIFHYLLVSASRLKPASFINRFVALTGARLLLYLFVILAYVFLVKYQPVSFLITFLCGYFVFTIFELIEILKFLKKNSTKSESTNQ